MPFKTEHGSLTNIRHQSIAKGRIILGYIEEMQSNGSLNNLAINFLKGLPSTLIQNGLGQTIAYMRTKKSKYYKDVLIIFCKMFGKGNDTILMNDILDSDVKEYWKMQSEAINYAGWMKEFAVAFTRENRQ